jgi:diguanylate cyclase (GGDEF)-like protein
MNTAHLLQSAAQVMLTSYQQLVASLLEGVSGVCLLNSKLAVLGKAGDIDADLIVRGVSSAAWSANGRGAPLKLEGPDSTTVVAISLESSAGSPLGLFCLQGSNALSASATATRLKPVLDCLRRELVAINPKRAKAQTLTERTAELEWLFNLSGNLKISTDDREVVRELLRAATERLQSAMAMLVVPERRLELEHTNNSDSLQRIAGVMRKHLLAWAQRHRKPLLINGNSATARISAKCKILSVPVVREGGRVVGVLAFLNPPNAPDFSQRHVFLARHLGRQAATLVDAQFDLMTGLYTRGGLEQVYRLDQDQASAELGSVLYVDIDRMQFVNELHGFELGNELIVRVAELVGASYLGDGVLAARISGDRFAVVFPRTETEAVAEIGAKLQTAAARLIIGPAANPVEVSLSCGIAALVPMPQGLARALAAAELACKKAKERGRGRIELYAFEDSSMMRSHGDAMAIGELRAAIKEDRLVLYAQPIVPLQNRSLPGGYELLMRLRDPVGRIVPPGDLINAAQRYQILPSVDRWVVRRALEMLTPYRGMLNSRGLSISVNVSGQSISDPEFAEQFVAQLRAAHLPAGCITVEMTEQAAVTNLAHANELFRKMGVLGCKLALDDFGTGANSLVILKTLPLARVKIDGSFVRDIVTDQRSQATVEAIVALARGYKIETVAEYVENQAIADVVRRLGVDYAQGYAFGKPEPLDNVLSGLGRDESRRLHKLFLEL